MLSSIASIMGRGQVRCVPSNQKLRQENFDPVKYTVVTSEKKK
eukprot:SAG31_NODE_160_length_21908_cov_25.529048_2_plen_43_part_00